MKYAFIGDVHGCYEELVLLLNKIPSEYKLVFLGDVCDKGPRVIDSLNKVNELMNTKGAIVKIEA